MRIERKETLDAYFGVANYIGRMADEAREQGDHAFADRMDEIAEFHANVYAGYAASPLNNGA
jgi:hypothetical protein